ncbi:MAG TPA: DUF456 domain-containing protein [Opitutaceae bacterium]|nr:DUF456 domain-containing protein [Opitutaceae bacterium]
MPYLDWSLTVLLLAGGLVGAVIPLLPGTTLILAGVVLHKLLAPGSLSWLAVGVVALVWLASLAVEVTGVMIGTRLGGGSKWGMVGAGGGALAGALVSLPALLLGTMLGAILAERVARKRGLRELLLAGLGAGLGFALSYLGRLACAVAMIAIFVGAALRG